eukprot:PITA_01756
MISPLMNQHLEAKISIKEITDALSDMEPDKAPGPDDFTVRFLQVCWQVVEKDLYKMALKSQNCQKIGGSTNSAFLALIPKEKGAKDFNWFRPISLCNIGYKISTKVIANRFKGILPAIIPKNQGGVASVRSALKLKEVLDDYSEATGSCLNKGKCKVFCWNIFASILSAITRILGFSASLSWSSFTYLGLPIFRKLAYNRDWIPLLDKFKAKIQAWGFSWLNLAGKSVLIKSFLSSLPIFQFSVILVPIGIIKKMEAFIRKFFWKGGNLNDKKIPLVSWEKVCKPQNEGGLNFKDLSLQNTAMGAKIFWRIIGPHLGWVQRALWRKYFMGKWKRCLESSLPTSRSQLIKLCHKAAPLIRDRA